MKDWDERYAGAAGWLFGRDPNEYVREICARSDFKAGSALCLGDGDGRNGAWLAKRGMAVTAVDISSVATERAHELDRDSGVKVERLVADLAEWAPDPERRWDSVFLLYLHCPRTVRDHAIRTAAAALVPGGWFVVEGFATAQAARSLGPDDPALLYDLEALQTLLPGFVVVEALTGRVRLEEGETHRGVAMVVRFAARRPD